MSMTPEQFVAHWAGTQLKETAAYVTHFDDLCELLGHDKPAHLDRTGEKFTYQKGVIKSGAGEARGFADVWYRGHFAWEYKGAGKHKDLSAAYQQLLLYKDALENPPLLVVSDIERYEIHTNFTNAVSRIYRFSNADIARNVPVAESRFTARQLLDKLFHDPEALRPEQTVEAVTQEAARQFAELADSMHKHKVAPFHAARFLVKLVFCLFCEDVGLLPKDLFSKTVTATRDNPREFVRHMQDLFGAMAVGGHIVWGEPIQHFDGGLFTAAEDDPDVVEFDGDDLRVLEQASKLNWADTDPSIFGTLFERALDIEGKRAQLGAHYTSRADIETLVEPVLMAPLRREWEDVKSRTADFLDWHSEKRPGAREKKRAALEKLLRDFQDRLAALKVLDPACGSGNFLYVSLTLLKDLEKQVITFGLSVGLPDLEPRVNPAQLYGVEKDDYAFQLASIVAWIGYLQWKAKNGYAPAGETPILKPLDTIRQVDAILDLTPSLTPALTPALSPALSQRERGRDSPIRGGEASRVKVKPPLPRQILQRCRELRRKATDAEKLLWQLLRNRQLNGAKFRRQQPVGRFILDFYCHEARLAIELDGGGHAKPDQSRYDDERTQALAAEGIRLIRFWNNEVLKNTEAVLQRIWEALTLPLSPALSQGESGSDSPLPPGEGLGAREPTWPVVDVIVGNPPFLGGKKMRAELGDEYVDALFKLYEGRVPHEADLVCYWFEKARAMIEAGKAKRAGLLATQAIRGGANREVLERIKQTGDIFWAQSDREWILDGAAVNISMVGFDGGTDRSRILDNLPVATINPDLTAKADLTQAKRLKENLGISFMGVTPAGPFDIPGSKAREWLSLPPNPNGRPNSDVIRPYFNGLDLTRRPRDVWIIDFGVGTSLEEVALYEAPFEYVAKNVKSKRLKQRSTISQWWLHERPRPEMRAALQPLKRYVGTSMVAKHLIFCWIPKEVLPANLIIVFARDDDYFFGVLHSKVHELWALRQGTSLEDRPRYTPTSTFETFPFPRPTPVQKRAIAEAARELNEKRESWLNPYKDEPSAIHADLKARTLTNLYNQMPEWLRLAHEKLDRAVLDAYGWPPDLSDDDILARLLEENLKREPAASSPQAISPVEEVEEGGRRPGEGDKAARKRKKSKKKARAKA